MKNKSNRSFKETFLTVPAALLLIFASLTGLFGCGKLKLVHKTEYGLNFAIPEEFELSNDYGFDIEYKGKNTAFYVDLISYSEYENIEYGSGITACTEAVIDALELGGVNINYNFEKNTAQFDAWVSDSEGAESYYNYITILISQSGIFAARYVCAGTDKAIKKNSESFAEMASYLSVVNP